MSSKAQIFQSLLTSQRASGVTLAAGKAYFYVPGTTTLKTVYADRNKATPAANPYTLSSDGTAMVYGDGLYDIKLTTATGVQRALWEDVSIVDILTVGVERQSGDFASLNEAITTIGSTPSTLNISTANFPVTANVAIPSTLELTFTFPGSLSVGTYTVTGLSESRPEWFNGSVWLAIQSLGTNGGTVWLQNKIYAPLGNTIVKDNVRLEGAVKPVFKSDATGLTGGTIIQGPLLFAANNLTIRNLGVDSGSGVCTSLYSGTAQEGLACTVTYYSGANLQKLLVENVVAIAQSATAQVHAFAVEGYDYATINNVETLFGTHGQAYKTQYSQISNIRSRGNSSNGIILKSQTIPTRIVKFNTIINPTVSEYAAGDTPVGIHLDGRNNIELSNNTIINPVIRNVATGIALEPATATDIVSDNTIIGGTISACGANGVLVRPYASRNKFIGVNSSGNTVWGILSEALSANNEFVNCAANNNASGIGDSGAGNTYTNCSGTSNAGWGIYAFTGATPYKTGFSGTANGSGLVGSGSGVRYLTKTTPSSYTAASLLGSWTNYDAATSQAGYTIDDAGTVKIRGIVKGGTVGTNIFFLPAGYLPPKNLRFPISTFNGATVGHGEIYIISDGTVQLSAAVGTTFVSMDGISFSVLP